VKAGSDSISWTPQNYDGLFFESGTEGLISSGVTYLGVSFWVHGGTTGGQQIRVQMRSDTAAIGNSFLVPSSSVVKNVWTLVYVSFSSLAIANGTPLDGVVFQSNLGTVQAILYLDDIALVTSSVGAQLASETMSSSAGTTLSSWCHML